MENTSFFVCCDYEEQHAKFSVATNHGKST